MEQTPLFQNQGYRTLAAIVVTDAVGFSARMSIEEESTLRIIQRDLQLMENTCKTLEGRVLKSTGDGLLLYFASAVQAVRCAIEIQHQLTQLNRSLSTDQSLLHRIGIHLGDVFFSQSDVMGNGVNIAARLQTEAQPGAICLSQIVYDVVKSQLDLDASFLGPLQLKNIQEAVPAYQIQPLQPQPTEVKPAASGAEYLPPGEKVAGRYVIQRLLGQGGFGCSYLAEDTQRFSELCVLKEFVPNQKSGGNLQKALDLFKREAKTLYQINHPQVPKFLACFTQAQRLFIVQEYIDGITYAQMVRRKRQQKETFSEAEVTQWLRQMLHVLDYLHGLSLIHRDISPDNVIFSRDRNLPILIDFGLVNDAINRIWSQANQAENDKPASMVGKFGYSPPEQMQLGQCYPCSDLYALGVTAVVLLTCQKPRELMDQTSLDWQWQQQVNLNPALVEVLEKLTASRPRDRYQAAKDVLLALDAVPVHLSQLGMDEPTAIASASQIASSNSVGEITISSPWPHSDRAFEFASQPPPSSMSLFEAAPDFIDRCQSALVHIIGPMGQVIVDDVLDQMPQAAPQDFVIALADQLSDSNQSQQLLSALQPVADETSLTLGATAQSSQSQRPEAPDNIDSTVPHSALQASSSRAILDSAFLERCQAALVDYIGPMASFLIEETLADNPHLDRQQLVQKLASEIPDTPSALQFQQQLLHP
ncbi:MAG: protein kinase [Cyanobacteria bacterium P01_H01_bin.119]